MTLEHVDQEEHCHQYQLIPSYSLVKGMVGDDIHSVPQNPNAEESVL